MLDYLYTIDLEVRIGGISEESETSMASLIESLNCNTSFSSLLASSIESLDGNTFRIFLVDQESDDDFCEDIESFLGFVTDHHMTVENGSEIKMTSTHSIDRVCFSWVYGYGEWKFYESIDNQYGISSFDDSDDYSDF